ncbi:Hypothetical predicted protein, partial [Scomber scombrus]
VRPDKIMRLFFDFLSESEESVEDEGAWMKRMKRSWMDWKDEEKEDAPGDELAEEDVSIVPPSS